MNKRTYDRPGGLDLRQEDSSGAILCLGTFLGCRPCAPRQPLGVSYDLILDSTTPATYFGHSQLKVFQPPC
jgi:hypothetical protein